MENYRFYKPCACLLCNHQLQKIYSPIPNDSKDNEERNTLPTIVESEKGESIIKFNRKPKNIRESDGTGYLLNPLRGRPKIVFVVNAEGNPVQQSPSRRCKSTCE